MKMKFSLPLAALLLTGAPLLAQTTGTSHPEDMDDTRQLAPDASDSHYVPPSHNSPAVSVTVTTPAPSTPVLIQRNPPMHTAYGNDARAVGDPDGMIVTDVPVGPNELPIGARLSGTLQQPISTETMQTGDRFTAALSSDIVRGGVVLLPAGTLVYGRISRIHGGRRMSGSSAIRLKPESLSLPDGTVYAIRAEVTDLDHHAASHVNDEGIIVSNGQTGRTATVIGVPATVGMVTGAVIGGPIGAGVGLGVGAGVGTIWWLNHVRQQELPMGTSIVFTLNTPLHVTPTAH